MSLNASNSYSSCQMEIAFRSSLSFSLLFLFPDTTKRVGQERKKSIITMYIIIPIPSFLVSSFSFSLKVIYNAILRLDSAAVSFLFAVAAKYSR